MSEEWKPGTYHHDPIVNAVMNVAREIAGAKVEIAGLAAATRDLLYGLKYSKDNGGLSIAEAIEVAGKAQAEAIDRAATAIEEMRDDE